MQKRSYLASQPCTVLKGVGPSLAEKLAQCDIHCLQDLLFHLPLRYLDNTRVTPIRQLQHGDHCVIEGTIVAAQDKGGKRRQLIYTLQDHSGSVDLRFLYYLDNYRKQLATGCQIRCVGEARRWGAKLSLVHPDFSFNLEANVEGQRLTPIYPSTSGLNQTMLRRLTDQVLQLLGETDLLPDYLPASIADRFSSLHEALFYLHRPPVDAKTELLLAGKHPMQQRLAFEELLAHHLSLRRLRAKNDSYRAHAFPVSQQLRPVLLQQLAFALTAAQQRVGEQIADDLARSKPMLRLIQGDVGCGKTIVAAMAALPVIEQGFQVALMAPTELLAEQHLQSFSQWLQPLGVKVELLLSRCKGAERQTLLDDIASGHGQMIIGTHALFQESVVFHQLGLVIIDEQHRFGVHQRLALREKGIHGDIHPHQMIMTATPIPRTLAMSVYADVDHSIIDELPPGRQPITTVVVANDKRDEVIQRIQHICSQGQQVYWVCTLIEESENLQCQTAEDTAQQLITQLPNLRIGMVHGRLPGQEKNAVMQRFQAGEFDILVATTVIEVGVDVPNATLMLIENAERLGLAQLHQLRGRVGRGSLESFCVMLYQHPLSHNAQRRLAVMRRTQDGFAIAKEDLSIRGPGEVLGTRQAGMAQLCVADLVRDSDLLVQVQQAALILQKEKPEIIQPLINRWLGRAEAYVHA